MKFETILEKFKTKLGSQGSLEFEIFLVRQLQSSVEAKEGQVNSFESAETLGAGLRVIQNKKFGFAYTSDFTEAGLDQAVRVAVDTAQYSDANPFLNFPQKRENEVELQDYDPSYLSTSPQKQIELALELEKSALAESSKVKRVRGASYQGGVYEVWLVNSWGLFAHHQKTMNVLSLMAVAEEGEEAEAGYEFSFSSFLKDLNPRQVGKQAARKALSYLGGKPGPTLKGPVLLDPLAAAEILEVLAPSFYADRIIKQCSLFDKKHLGTQILSPQISLVEDGLLKAGYASFPFDGEGVPKTRVCVVRQGQWQSLFADTEYANRLGMPSSGSSVREDFKRPPRIGCSNFFIEPGEHTPEALLQKIDQGVLITELIGMHTANPISGDFSVGAQGFLIQKGEKAYPVKQIALSGNLKTMMNQVEEVGSDLRFAFKMGSPSLLISEMDVAGV